MKKNQKVFSVAAEDIADMNSRKYLQKNEGKTIGKGPTALNERRGAMSMNH